MREAQKMMQDPQFQAYMKSVTQNAAFKGAMKKTNDTLKDPKKRKEVEEKMKKRMEEGEQELENIKKELGEDATDDDVMRALADKRATEGDKKKVADDKKKAAKGEADDDEGVDDVPDMGSINLN